MNLEITQSNLHLLLPVKVAGISKLYAEEHNCGILESMRLFYSSALYRQLAIESTKLWQLGVVPLYQIWQGN